MRRIFTFTVFLLTLMLLFETNAFGADYFLHDKETNKILFMGKNDPGFIEKIDMEKTPDFMMATDNPDVYLAIFTPENEKKSKMPQKGQLIIFDIAKGRTEDPVELGYAPFRWVYSNDRRNFFISYKPTPDAASLELLHYNITERTTEKLGDLANEINQLILSKDETKLYALVPGIKKKKEPGKILVLNSSPLTLLNTIPVNVNPDALFVIGSERLVIIDADIRIWKKPGALRIINSSDYSIIEEKEFPPPYNIYNYFNPNTDTLITIASLPASQKSYIYKISPYDLLVNEIESKLLDYRYIEDKNRLYLLTAKDLQMLDYNTNQLTVCDTGSNHYDVYPYQINLIPGSDMAALYCPAGGKVKFIDLNQNSLIASAVYGRSGAKVGNFMTNLMVSLLISGATAYSSGGSYYSYYYVDVFRNGVNVAVDNSKYYVLRAATRDITVFDDGFESPSYIVPPENPLIMFQINHPTTQTLLVTKEKIYQIISEDLTLKPIIAFSKKASNCLLLEEEHRLVVMTDQELLVIDSPTFEVKNKFELFGNPDQEYNRIKPGEQRYHYIPTL